MPCRLLPVLLLPLLTSLVPAPQPATPVARDIQTLASQGRGTPAGRAAWDRVAAGGPELLPALLRAMDTPDTVAANWLRTALHQIAERACRARGKGVDVDALLALSKDPGHPGRARRLAPELG